MVVQPNSDGRPCAWGVASSEHEARAEAGRQWDTHGHPPGEGCYPGERKGKPIVHGLKTDPTAHE